jgi:Tol biopolymer transport system component
MLIDRDVVEIRYTSGHLVYALADGSLHAVAFDPVQGRIVEEPVQIAGGVALTGTLAAQFAVAENGTVVYVPEEPRSLVLASRDGSMRPATPEKRNFHAPLFSPNGRRIATDFNSADGRDVWVLDLGDGRLSRATFDRDGHDATWMPDGASLTYTSVKDGVLTLQRIRPGVSQSPERLMASRQLGYSGFWLWDSTSLVTVANSLSSNSGSDLAWVRNAGKGPIEAIVSSRFEEHYPAVSRDDRFVAFVSNQSGQDQVYVRPLKGAGEEVQVSLTGGTEPVWSHDGKELFYRTGAGAGSELIAAAVSTSSAFGVSSRKALFSVAEIVTSTPHRNYDVSPDGKTFAMVKFNPSARIMVIQNLPAVVKALRGAR